MAFQNRHSGINARWELLAPHLPQQPSWGLDIGSNLGDTAYRAAALGHTMIGLETSRKLVMRATAAAPRNVAFMVGEASPDSLSRMPRFAFIFMLSVLHRIWAVGGRSYAENCFRASMDKAELILFEGSMRHARYQDCGQDPPDFESNNIDAAISWHMDWLTGLSSPHGWTVKHLGAVPCSVKEPYRPLFLLEQSKGSATVSRGEEALGAPPTPPSSHTTERQRLMGLGSKLAALWARLLPSHRCYQGTVFTGIKKGTRVVPKYTELLRRLTGMTIVPGTLNVRLEKELVLSPPVTFRGWRAGQTLTPALLNGVPVFLYRWPKCKSTRVEVLSDVHLRSRLKLHDGDVISICIENKFVQSKPR